MKDNKNISYSHAVSIQENIISIFIISAIWLFFRVYVYANDWFHIIEMLPVEGLDWVAFPAEYLKNNFMKSIYYFWCEPPLPQIIIGIFIKVFGWPFSLPYIPFFLSFLSLFSAIFIRDIMCFFKYNIFLSTAIAALWCLSTDCMAYEIDAYPKALYELLTGFFFVFSLWALVRYVLAGKAIYFLLFSFLSVCLIMTRSTLSFFFIVPLAIGFFIGTRISCIFGVVPLLCQLLLSFKNYHIYGNFVFETSSFAVENFIASLASAGYLDDFWNYARSVDKNKMCVFYFLNSGEAPHDFCQALIDKAMNKEEYLSAVIGIPVGGFGYGSPALYELSYPMKHLYVSYIFEKPVVLFDIVRGAYSLFWGACKDGVTPIVGLINDRFFIWMSRISDFHRYLNMLIIHSLFLVSFIFVSLRSLRGRRALPADIVFYYAALSFLYVAVVSSIADFSENNRYRFVVEQIIWLLPFISFSVLRNKFPVSVGVIK